MKIRAILEVFTAARDRNGNCYHAAQWTDTESGAVIRFGDIGGRSNMHGLRSLLGFEWDSVIIREETLPIREWKRLTKGWPYIANHADEKAVEAVKAAIREVTK